MKARRLTIRVGDVVRLRRTVQRQGARQMTSVVRFNADVPGGVVLAERIADFRYWNIDDLERVNRKRKAARS